MKKPDLAHRLTDQELAALEKSIAAEYKKAADELQEKIDAYFASFAKRDAEQKALIGTIVNGREYTEKDYRQWRLAQIGRGRRFEALRDRLAERMTNANEVAAAYINDATPGLYSLNRNYAAYTIEQQVGADVGFDLWDEQTVRRLLVEQPDLMPYYPPKRAVQRGIDLAYGKRQITAQVTSGILQGESIKHLADRLQTNIPNMNRTSAIRAARTAVTGAQNAGRLDSYLRAEEMGISLEKQWIATLDGRTRHDHAAADGQTVEEYKPFIVGGHELMYPGDPSGPGHEIYNCRCTMIAKVKGVDMSNAKRRARDHETGERVVVENITYTEWWKRKETKRQETADIGKTFEYETNGKKKKFAQIEYEPTAEEIEKYDVIGIRAVPKEETGVYGIGDTLSDSFDFDFEEGVSTYFTTKETLGGSSALYIDYDEDIPLEELLKKAMGGKYEYEGTDIFIIGGNNVKWGDDPGEVVIGDAKAIGKIGIYNKQSEIPKLSSLDIKVAKPTVKSVIENVQSVSRETIEKVVETHSDKTKEEIFKEFRQEMMDKYCVNQFQVFGYLNADEKKKWREVQVKL